MFLRPRTEQPTHGLVKRVGDIRKAVDEQGQSQAKSGWDPVFQIYTYIESGMPVILLLAPHDGASADGHAVLAVGHTVLPLRHGGRNRSDNHPAKTDVQKPEWPLQMFSTHEWVDAFIVHDDQQGPYRLLPVDQAARHHLCGTELEDRLTRDRYPDVMSVVEGIIVPLPGDGLYLTGFDAETAVITFLRLRSTREDIALPWQKHGVEAAKELFLSLLPGATEPATIRTYFVLSAEFKESVRRQNAVGGIHETVRAHYLGMDMPKWIWVHEISTEKYVSHRDVEERSILGEILVDATASTVHAQPFLAVHMPGKLIKYDRKNTALAVGFEYLPEDQPYSCCSRSPAQLRVDGTAATSSVV
jgi:hypothetical protein